MSRQLYGNDGRRPPDKASQPRLQAVPFLAQLDCALCFRAFCEPRLSPDPVALPLSPKAAWHYADGRVVAQALDLARVGRGHDINQVIVDHEPDGSADMVAVLSVRLEVDVLVLGKPG